MEILLRNGANINEKDVRNISVGETDDFVCVCEREQRTRERRGEREMEIEREMER